MDRLLAGIVAFTLAGGLLLAQSYPPGYVDPAPLLEAASKEIGERGLRCITFSGTGYNGAVGQTAEFNPNIDWPRIDALNNYTRTINWETGTSKETFDRKPGLNPASWKYGLGWRGGTPSTDAGQAGTFDPPFPNHNIMHGHGKLGLASLCNLERLPPTGAILIAAPLKLVNGSGSPVRAIALVPL